MQSGINRQTSLREKLKSSICCFTGAVHRDPLDHGEGFYNRLHIPRTPISPAGSTSGTFSWLKKSPTSTEYSGDSQRMRGRSLRSRIGRKHRPSQSADFSYDPSSYALNFESESPEESFPFRDFSSRLPVSPRLSPMMESSSTTTEESLSPTSPSSPLKYTEEMPKEIVGYS